MIGQMAEQLPKPPRKTQILQYYSQIYYKDTTKGIKAYVDRTWPALSKEVPLPGQKKLKHLEYANKITAQFYTRETKEF